MAEPPHPGGYRGLQHGVRLPQAEMVAVDAEGCYIETASGERYVDYILGSGAVICGHSHPRVTEVIQAQVARNVRGRSSDSSSLVPPEIRTRCPGRLILLPAGR